MPEPAFQSPPPEPAARPQAPAPAPPPPPARPKAASPKTVSPAGRSLRGNRRLVAGGLGAAVLLAILYLVFREPSSPKAPPPPPPLVARVELAPGQSIETALAAITDSGIVILGPGEYRLETALTLSRPFRLLGAGRDSTTILVGPAGSLSVGPDAGPFDLGGFELRANPGAAGTALLAVAAPIGRGADLRFRGPGVSGEECGPAGTGIVISGASAMELVDTEVLGLCTGIQITDSAQPELRGNAVTANQTGVRFLQQSGGTLRSNRIWANHDGVVIHGGSPTLEENEITGNRGFGLYGDPGASPRLLKNRIRNNLGVDIEIP